MDTPAPPERETAAAAAAAPGRDAAGAAPIRCRDAAPADLDAVLALLARRRLPQDGVAAHFGGFVVAERAGRLVAVGGLETYPADRRCALLRSVATDVPGVGLGTGIVMQLIERAHRLGIGELWLLTTTAAEYFLRFGFVRADRSTMPAALGASAELRGACPASAVAMRLELRERPAQTMLDGRQPAAARCTRVVPIGARPFTPGRKKEST